MVLRQMGTSECMILTPYHVKSCDNHVITCLSDPAEREKKVRESVERAREAVAEDVKDGTSWSECDNISCPRP